MEDNQKENVCNNNQKDNDYQDNRNYILQRTWKSKVPNSREEILYLSYREDGSIDIVPNKEDAMILTKEECETWLMYVSGKKFWSIVPASEQETKDKSENNISETEDDNYEQGNN